MELHVRELFAGKWMEDKTVDVEDSIENGRSVGIVRVDLHSNLADLRKEIDQQISQDNDVPRQFGFVERLGKQLVEIWEEEEPVLRVKDLVGRETEILIVDRADQNIQSSINVQSRKTKKKGRMQTKGSGGRIERQADDDDESYARPPANAPSRGKRSLGVKKFQGEELYSADESRRRRRSLSRQRTTRFTTDDYQSPPLRQQSYQRRSLLRRQNNRPVERSSRMRSEPRNGRSSDEQEFLHETVRQTSGRGRRKTKETKRQWIESDPESSPRTSDSKTGAFEDLDREKKEEIERNRPATVRIRKERSLTEELRFRGDRQPSLKNSIMKKSVSIDDLRSLSSSDADGFATADSGRMDDYFLDRQPFSFSALNLRDMEKRNSQMKRRFEPSKMERRISGLLNRIRDVQEKIHLLKTIGEEHWRGRFYQLRRSVAPLEDRLGQLEDEEDDIEQNLTGLFQLRKPLRTNGMYGTDSKKNAYILEAQNIQTQINQLNAQLENIDLDLLKYRKMRDITENENGSLSRDINREKFLRHLLLNRSLQSS